MPICLSSGVLRNKVVSRRGVPVQMKKTSKSGAASPATEFKLSTVPTRRELSEWGEVGLGSAASYPASEHDDKLILPAELI
jgi:hypothetical protein